MSKSQCYTSWTVGTRTLLVLISLYTRQTHLDTRFSLKMIRQRQFAHWRFSLVQITDLLTDFAMVSKYRWCEPSPMRGPIWRSTTLSHGKGKVMSSSTDPLIALLSWSAARKVRLNVKLRVHRKSSLCVLGTRTMSHGNTCTKSWYKCTRLQIQWTGRLGSHRHHNEYSKVSSLLLKLQSCSVLYIEMTRCAMCNKNLPTAVVLLTMIFFLWVFPEETPSQNPAKHMPSLRSQVQ